MRYARNRPAEYADPTGYTSQASQNAKPTAKDTDFFKGGNSKKPLEHMRDVWKSSYPHKQDLTYEITEWIIIKRDDSGQVDFGYHRWKSDLRNRKNRRHGKWQGRVPDNAFMYFHTHPFPGKQVPSPPDIQATKDSMRTNFVVTEDYIFVLRPVLNENKDKVIRVDVQKLLRTDEDREKIDE